MRKPGLAWLRRSSSATSARALARGVAEHCDVGGAVEADRAGVDVELGDLRLRGDQRAVLGRPVVDRGADDQHRVGLGEQLGAERRGEPARDPEPVGEPGEQPVGGCGRGQKRAGQLAEGLEVLTRVGEDRSAAGDDRGALGLGEQVCRGLDRGGVGRGGIERWERGPGGLCRCGRLGLDVDREHQHHRPALDDRPLVGALSIIGSGSRAVYALGDRADGLDQVVLVDPEVRGQRRRWRLARQHQHRRTALGRLGQPGHRVGQAGALVHAAYGDAAGHPPVPVGHADRPALVAGVVEAGAAANERVGDDEVAAAEDPECVPDALRRDRLSDDIGHRGGLGGLRGGQPHPSESLTGRRSYMPSGRDVSFRAAVGGQP